VRIAHISDIHWRGIDRHTEYREAFEQLFLELKELNPNLIVNTGDTFHTKTHGITPELIGQLSWMYQRLSEIAPVYTILGNHDGNLSNLNRQDIISPIHEAISSDRIVLFKRSGVYQVGEDVVFCVFSVFDKEGWESVKPVPGKINIALYHGSVDGCYFDNAHIIGGTVADTNMEQFDGFDFVLLGDIHTSQFTRYRQVELVVDENELEQLQNSPGYSVEILESSKQS